MQGKRRGPDQFQQSSEVHSIGDTRQWKSTGTSLSSVGLSYRPAPSASRGAGKSRSAWSLPAASRYVLATLLILVLAPRIAFSQDEENQDPLLQIELASESGKFYGKALSEFTKDIANYAALKASWSLKIQRAREAYWRAYPNGPGFAKARDNFARLLWEKDLFYAYVDIVFLAQGDPDSPEYKTAMGGYELATKVGGELDGGIPHSAIPEFDDWSQQLHDIVWDEVRAKGGGTITGFFQTFPEAVMHAFEETKDSYRTYVVARDWAEFAAAGREPAWITTPALYAQALMMRYLHVSPARAEAEYKDMAAVLGKEHVDHVAEEIRQAPKNRDGRLVNPQALGLTFGRTTAAEEDQGPRQGVKTPAPSGMAVIMAADGYTAFRALVTQSDARRYLLGLIVQAHVSHVPGAGILSSGEWTKALGIYQKWVLAYGKDAVLAEAADAEKAPKSWSDGLVLDKDHRVISSPYAYFESQLAHKDLRGYILSNLIFGHRLQNPQAASSVYQKLVATYGEQAVLRAARQLLDHVGTADEFGDQRHAQLVGLLDGSLHSVGTQWVDNPDYLKWREFAPGATVTTLTHSYSVAGQREIPADESVRSTYKLLSVDDKRASLSLVETVYHSRWTAPTKTHQIEYPARIQSISARPAWSCYGCKLLSQKSGTEALTVDGKSVRCQWKSNSYTNGPENDPTSGVTTTTEWTSDEVPGSFVRRVNERKNKYSDLVFETVLVSFTGFRKDASEKSVQTALPSPTPPPGAAITATSSSRPTVGIAAATAAPVASRQPQPVQTRPAENVNAAHSGPSSGELSYHGSPVPQNGEVVFDNLPPGTLTLTYDTSRWSARIVPGSNGTQEIIFRSKKPGMQSKLRVKWSITK